MSNTESLTWEQVKPIWDTHLWAGRDSEPVTSMKYLGGYDMAYKEQTPHFIGITHDDAIIAVNSYVPTEGSEWRSRGLWVHPDHRGRNHAKTLLYSMIDHVKSMGCERLWTMPRKEALGVYQAVGFTQITTWETHDWGENCYAQIIFLDWGRHVRLHT